MRKDEFLEELRAKLKGLPKNEISDQVSFYDEMISDMVADGDSEEEAIAKIGTTDNVLSDIADKTPMVKLVKEKISPKRKLGRLAVALIILGFPIWFPLILTGLILVLVAYILLWVGVIVTYSVELALGAYGLGGIIAFMFSIADGAMNNSYLAFGFLGIGGAILFAFVCIATTKGTLKLAKAILLGIKKHLLGGGSKNA